MPITADSITGQWTVHRPDSLKLKKHVLHAPPLQDIDIIDIRQAAVEINLKEDINSLFNPENGPRRLPTLLLYDEAGLQLFEKITYLDEYYLTNCEIQVLERSAVEIARVIPSGSMVIELGSGNLRKVILLLQALENAGKSVDYYALDLSRKELERTLAHVPAFKYVRCHGLHGTYDDGREWLKSTANLTRQKCLLNLGSSIGNFERDEAASFLRSLADVLRPTDLMLIGLDACQDPGKVYHAYNDREGVTHQFVLNGLTHANRVLGERVFDEAHWKVIGEYVFDGEGGRHQAFYAPTRTSVVMGTVMRPHERIQVEQSLKYSQREAAHLWKLSGLKEVCRWTNSDNDYGEWFLIYFPQSSVMTALGTFPFGQIRYRVVIHPTFSAEPAGPAKHEPME
ncbi:uncharacterized protein MKZ38_006614 [Zalerion maritima]|uniref:Histidine-specific methyltransferase SAM-dependent domain-containing protein n=1 Tax=Zalerion maritima TaxID=339359 RepID=A0AAD5WPP2_9PEZI|nr:uncharacterized protein MKZ38_006614 [Zalerion maritima]